MISKTLLTIVILLNLYRTNGCFRSFVSTASNYNKNNISLRDINDNYSSNNRTKVNLILIDNPRTCNQSLLDSKKVYFHCYHNGKCLTVEKELNNTHYERHSFCLCQKNYGGEDCRADDSFLDEANVSITLIAIIAGIGVGALILFYVYAKKKPAKFRPLNNVRSSSNNTDLVRGIINTNPNESLFIDSEAGLLLNGGKVPIYRQVSSLSNKTGEVINNLNLLRKATNERN